MGEKILQSKEKASVVERLRGYINSVVEVHLLDEQVIRGRLVQADEDMINLFLEDCIDISGKASPAAVVMGSSISHINIVSLPAYESLDEKIFDLIEKNGDMSINEIAKMLNAKPSNVKSALLRLKKKGLVSASKEGMRKSNRK